MPITYLDEPKGKITYLDESTTPTKEPILPKLAGAGAGVAAASGVGLGLAKIIPKVVSGVKNLPNVVNTGKQAKFAENLQTEFAKVHTQKVNKFGNSLTKLAKANPDAAIDLSGFVGEINTPEGVSQQALSIFKKTPKLGNMLDNPELAKAVSLRDAQDIINHLNTKIPKQIKANNLDVLDAINTVKAEQLQAFPKMAKVRAEYAAFKEPYVNLKKFFGFNKTIPAIESKVPFGGAQGWEEAKGLLPKETIKNIKGYRYAKGAKEVITQPGKPVSKLMGFGKMLSVAPMLLQAIGMSKSMEEAKKKGGFYIDEMGNIIPKSLQEMVL